MPPEENKREFTRRCVEAHIDRIIKATNDLWKQPDSVCEKCHDTDEPINCLFCFCPLYYLKEKCGGDFIILENGVKDCSNCMKHHDPKWVKQYLLNVIKIDSLY